MKKIRNLAAALVVAASLFTACSSSGLAGLGSTMELVNSLGKLGISPEQAIGGIGSLLSLANFKLDPADFSKVSGAFPDLENIMNKTKELGIDASSITDMAGVGDAFDKLGMDSGKVTEFVPELTNFASKQGGQEAGDLLSGVFK